MLLFIKDLASKYNVELHIVESVYDEEIIRSMVAYGKNFEELLRFIDKISSSLHVLTSVKEEDGYYYVVLGLETQ